MLGSVAGIEAGARMLFSQLACGRLVVDEKTTYQRTDWGGAVVECTIEARGLIVAWSRSLGVS